MFPINHISLECCTRVLLIPDLKAPTSLSIYRGHRSMHLLLFQILGYAAGATEDAGARLPLCAKHSSSLQFAVLRIKSENPSRGVQEFHPGHEVNNVFMSSVDAGSRVGYHEVL
uniref:Uncharacterized protein n=1 Tax=Arundo donax TaxID=35708 RepID=A0A0A9BPY0_ARUDO